MSIRLSSGTWRNGRKTGTANPNSYNRAIIQIGEQIGVQARLALEEVAENIVITAKSLAPGDGKLKDSIKWYWVKNRDGWQIKINSTPAKNASGVSYGQYAEWDPLFSKDGQKPFLYPAMDAHREEFDAVIKKTITEVIRRYGS